MKRLLVTLILTGILPSLFVGCGGGGKKTAMDTTAFTAAFQNASGDKKANATAASAAVKSGNLDSAAAAIEKMVKAGGLSSDEKNAVSEILVSMQMAAYEDDKKYSDTLRTKLSDLSGDLIGTPAVSK